MDQFDKESKELAAELAKLLETLTAPIEVADLKKQSAELKQLKESVKPLSDQVDSFSSECKVLIKAAGPEAKTIELVSSFRFFLNEIFRMKHFKG